MPKLSGAPMRTSSTLPEAPLTSPASATDQPASSPSASPAKITAFDSGPVPRAVETLKVVLAEVLSNADEIT